MEFQGTLASRLRLLRKNYQLSVKNFAYGCGVSDVTIFKLEKGTQISEKTLSKISFTYGTTRDWLIDGTGEMLPHGMNEVPFDEIEKRYVGKRYDLLISKNEQIEKEIKKIWSVLRNLGGDPI